MIVCSKAADVVTRMAIGKDKTVVSDINSILERLPLDATLTRPKTEAFVISENDITKPKIRQQFMDAIVRKHPTVRVVVLAKQKTTMMAGGGIDKLLVAPKAPQVAEALNELLESIANKVPIIGGDSVQELPAQKFVPEEFTEELKEAVADAMTQEAETTEELPLQAEAEVPNIPQYTQEDVTNTLLDRIRACNQVADLSIVVREANATRVVKQLLEENGEYATIEERLQAYRQKIMSIMMDTAMTLEEKLSKVRAISYDKASYAAKGSTILEQRVEEIIKVVCEKVKEIVEEKNRSLDRVILEYSTTGNSPVIDFPMLSGLLDTRANIIMDLALLNKEVKGVFLAMDKLASDTTEKIISDNTEMTGTPALDNVIELRGARITIADGCEVVNKVLALATDNSEKFAGYERTVKVMNDKLVALLKTDSEIIEQQGQIIKYLTSQNVEDTVIANTFIKKALRLYVGKPGTGRTFLTYGISKLRSRGNANVLYMNLTGEKKLGNYGVKGMELADWLNNVKEEPFCVVENSIVNLGDVGVVQRLANSLVKAADYYRVINVVLLPEQELLFQTLVQDALSVNYVTDMVPENLAATREYIQGMREENVAQRVFLNKCFACTENIVRRLGLEERLNVECLRFPYVQQVGECALNGVEPTCVDLIEECLREVMKRA